MIVVPAASPSMPSVRFTAFAAPAITKKTSTYQPQPSGNHLSTIGTKTECRSCWWCAASPTAAVSATSSAIFTRPDNPSERRWRSLM